MNKILLIIVREYLTRVKKKSFIVMTILGPLLMAAIVIVPVYLAMNSNETKRIAVLDQTGLFYGKFRNSENLKFHYLTSDLESAKTTFSESGDHALLFIPKTDVSLPTSALLYSEKQVNINVKSHIRNVMSKEIEELKLSARLDELQQGNTVKVNIDDFMKSIKTSIDINTIKLTEGGVEERSNTEMAMGVGFFAGILIYFFIFMFGSQVMRGVIEEKTSRIVEVIISSVKPFQLMMGKIIGVALVGLTQFLLWVLLTFIIITAVITPMTKSGLPGKSLDEKIAPVTNQVPGAAAISLDQAQESTEAVNEVIAALNSVDFPIMILSFLFYFLFGYLMYAALFAGIGGAVDSEADTQQFMLPITTPLILAMVLMQFIVQEPDGPLAFWFSIIPLTSPVVMMLRIPFGVPYWEVALSMALLILGFLGTTWLASKIYRTGILMYGKKVNYRELWKWLRY